MQVEVLENSERRAKLVVRGVPAAFMNALRRTMIAEVPKLAIEDVTIYDNTGALFDEMLAHRLGLLPVPTEPGVFNYRETCEACKGEGCPNCTVLYTLSKEGPGMVLSGDLTPADPRFAIPDPDIPIVKLLEGQRVMLEAAAVLGTSARHAKWAPVVAVGYREVPHVTVKGSLPPAVTAELEPLAPKDAVVFEDGRVRVVDEEKAYDFLHSAAEKLDLPGVEFSLEKEAWIFRIETDGALTAKQVLQQAIGILVEKLKAVEETAPKLAKEA